ncbi:hypothetical protein PDJAM_G00028520 [Pangasius djambal]|uniref:Uncharacterized protein n=1 Tax=Pangasius djambal TaxID=1691987 RepID=A0ACC5YQA6_9TELE|nr:hypothetical protein [Pangasius djambal]
MSMSSRLPTERRRDSLVFCVPEPVPKPSYAVRRRFSGPLLLPPLSRRHSILDTKKLLDLEALYKSALANLQTPILDVSSTSSIPGIGSGSLLLAMLHRPLGALDPIITTIE